MIKYWNWNGASGTIPYTFAANVSNEDKTIILSAMNAWQSLIGKISFIARTNQSDYIEFNNSGVNGPNNSSIGRIGGKQQINLGQGTSESTAEHEIGHALGLFHEQSRTDRDQYITINLNNIKNNMVHNFTIFTQDNYQGINYGPFDFNSIMLYESFIRDLSFVYNTSIPTMTKKDGTTWGYNSSISNEDVQTVKNIYNPPIYVKEINTRTVEYSQNTMNTDYEVYTDTLIVSFYSNAAKTIPLTLTEALNLRVAFSHEEPSNPSNTYYAHYLIQVPAGVSTAYLLTAHSDWMVEYGNYTFNSYIEGISLERYIGYQY